MKLNKYIDHTILKASATEEDVRKICEEALKYNFASVCVNPCHVRFVKKMLKDSDVKTCCVIGFPLGANSKESKIFETKNSIKNGADEIDMVINIGYLRSGKEDDVYEEIRDIKKACGKKILKVIIETCYLSDDEKKKASMLSLKAKADFVKTSTGFGTDGATLEDVKLMKDVVGDNVQIKAAGGIRDHETAMKYIELGATRLGTSSGIAIMEGVKSEDGTY